MLREVELHGAPRKDFCHDLISRNAVEQSVPGTAPCAEDPIRALDVLEYLYERFCLSVATTVNWAAYLFGLEAPRYFIAELNQFGSVHLRKALSNSCPTRS